MVLGLEFRGFTVSGSSVWSTWGFNLEVCSLGFWAPNTSIKGNIPLHQDPNPKVQTPVVQGKTS